MTRTPQATGVSAVHLDAVGGIAGDMFVAAILDVRPDLWCRCEEAVAAMDPPAGIRYELKPHGDGTLNGTRFLVHDLPEAATAHDHVHWSGIRARIAAADMEPEVRDAAIGIFTRLAEAEASVHGVAVEHVAFHEVGAWDSIVDIVAAAALVTGIGPARWSVGVLPRGRGLVATQHGMLPVPVPAVTCLLEGYAFVDDGEDGERITPTGAAILAFLGTSQAPDPVPRRLVGSGIGFGTRSFAGRSNVLRAGLYDSASGDLASDEVEVLRCEIDDQTGEDLAIAVDHLRALPGVLDLCQWPVLAKKGRLAVALQIVARPEHAETITAACLDETTTLGVRRQRVRRSVLPREMVDIGETRVKVARRPSRVSAKAENDDIAAVQGARRRRVRRDAAERMALLEGEGDAG